MPLLFVSPTSFAFAFYHPLPRHVSFSPASAPRSPFSLRSPNPSSMTTSSPSDRNRNIRPPQSPTTKPSKPNTQLAASLTFLPTRRIITLLGICGALEALFLTVTKLFTASPSSICSTPGCIDVLTGPYSTLFGIPLSLYGTTAYFFLTYLANFPISSYPAHPKRFISRDHATRLPLLVLATAMFTFSCYLMTLLTFVIKGSCPYCIVSAVLSTVIFAVTLRGALAGNAVSAIKAVFVTVLATLGISGVAFASTPTPPPRKPPEITEESSGRAMKVGEKLKAAHTRMYGAWWCTHCYHQKQQLGKQAFGERVDYVECARDGYNTQYSLCREKKVPGYPTWEIEGQLIPGELTLDQLEEEATVQR